MTCIFPTCTDQVESMNRANQPTCHLHQSVVVSGSYVEDRHHGVS